MTRKTKNFAKPIIFFGILLILVVINASAQENIQSQSRGIKSKAFNENRKKADKKGAKQANNNSRAYRNKGNTKRYDRRNSSRSIASRPESQPTAKPTEVEVGVTMWRLRPPLPGETGPFLPVRLDDGTDANWTPVRVDEDTVFNQGDRVRFTVESQIEGYLYIIYSESYSDGTIGDPYLIFPEKLEEDNRVIAGMLVAIPDQEVDYPYLVITESIRKNYAGEALLVIISPEPLKTMKTLKTDKGLKITSLDVLDEIEENAEAQILSSTDGVGNVLTTAEKDATCGSRTRQLTRQSNKPCGNKTRQLTREDPEPQTRYQMKSYPGKPIAFQMLMNVKAN